MVAPSGGGNRNFKRSLQVGQGGQAQWDYNYYAEIGRGGDAH